MSLVKSKNEIILSSFFLLLFITSFDIIFQENIPLPQIYEVIKLADEIFIVLFFLLTFFSRKISFHKDRLLILLCFFVICGFCGNINTHSPIKVFLIGMFSTIKPILLFWAFSQYSFKWNQVYNFFRKFNLLFPIIVISYVCDLFIPTFRYDIGIVAQAEDIRMGIRSLGGLFNRFTNGILFALIYYIFYRFYTKCSKWKYYFAVFMIISSLKIKDIFGFFVGNTLLYFHKFKKRYLIIVGIGLFVLFNAYATLMPEHYGKYIGNKDRSNIARVVLYETSFKILIDYFPFGVGFGKFASPTTQQYQSKIYADYGIDNVYGLSYGEYDGGLFMADTFWPMIFGETGILGTVLYILILSYCFKPFVKGFFKDTRDLHFIFPAFLFFVFLVASVGKPVFNGPPHCLVLWGVAGIFKSLSTKNIELDDDEKESSKYLIYNQK